MSNFQPCLVFIDHGKQLQEFDYIGFAILHSTKGKPTPI